MKELSIKEKAERYDEAIEIARKLNNGEGVPAPPDWTAYEVMFPELKESDDERIRKSLLGYLHTLPNHFSYNGSLVTEWIAWLEKQGEKDNLSIDFVLGYLGIKPAYKDGNAWCILLGDNIQEGICGFGDTKEEALIAFIKELIEKQGEQKSTNSKEDDVRRVSTIQVLEYAKSLPDYNQFGKDAINKNIAWVKKQGEKPQGKSALEAVKEEKVDNQNCVKLVDEVEPKFKVGDWIVHNINKATFFISSVNNGYCTLKDTEGKIYAPCLPPTEDDYHLWTIQDAKAGDVLVCKGNIKNSNGIKYERICLFNKLDEAFFTLTKASNYVEECDINVKIDYPDNTVPATKKQKEILFMAMTNAGYTFDFEEKELKKIEQKPVDIVAILKDYFATTPKEQQDKDWEELKYLNDIGPDIEIAFGAKDSELVEASYYIPKGFHAEIDGDKVVIKKGEQNPTWSEDDETMIDAGIQFAHEYGRHGLWCWLKDLKDRVQSQTTWKPSDEQMMGINCAINTLRCQLNVGDKRLNSLYDDLKKLRG